MSALQAPLGAPRCRAAGLAPPPRCAPAPKLAAPAPALPQRLLASAPARRLDPSRLAEASWLRNKLVETAGFLDNLALKDAAEKVSSKQAS